jgi:hypothetical protein
MKGCRGYAVAAQNHPPQMKRSMLKRKADKTEQKMLHVTGHANDGFTRHYAFSRLSRHVSKSLGSLEMARDGRGLKFTWLISEG